MQTSIDRHRWNDVREWVRDPRTRTSIASARSTHVSTARTLGRSLVVGGVTLLVSYIAGELLLG